MSKKLNVVNVLRFGYRDLWWFFSYKEGRICAPIWAHREFSTFLSYPPSIYLFTSLGTISSSHKHKVICDFRYFFQFMKFNFFLLIYLYSVRVLHRNLLYTDINKQKFIFYFEKQFCL